MLTHRASPRLAILIARAWIGLALFDIARSIGFVGIHRRVRTCRVGRRAVGTPEAVVWAVDEACVWYVKPAYCLQRSAVTVRLLRRSGFDGRLIIGYRPVPFESHAWVEIDGRIVNDRPQYRKYFHVLEQL
jgi:transglutaminase superfamily protein